jgi:gliding motility-associated-like protein
VKIKQAPYLLITGLYLLIVGQAYSQNVFQKTYGGTATDYSEAIKATSDLGFILGGTTSSYGTGGADARDLYVSKHNLLGITTWSHELGTSNRRQEAKFVLPLADGGYLVGGRTGEVLDLNDSWLIKKYDAVGTAVHERELGKTNVNSNGGSSWDDELYASEETILGNIVALTGFTMDYRVADEKEVTFVLYNLALGTIATTRHFGGPAIAGAVDDEGKDICIDNGALSYSMIAETGIGGTGTRDLVIIRLSNLTYNLNSYKTFGGTGTEKATSITKTSDGGYLLVGYSNSPGTSGGDDMLIIKLDNALTVTWSRMIGGAADDRAFQAEQTSDGGYIIVGETFSYGFGGSDMIAVKLTSLGTLSWAKCYGGTGTDNGKSLGKRSDGGFFFSGQCSEPVSPLGNGIDLYVVATNSTGYSGGCNEMSVTPNVVSGIALSSVTTGLSQVPGDPAIENVVNPMTENSVAPTLTCKCAQYAPNHEITGAIQVCHNTTGNYYVNKIPGHTNYLWTLTGATFVTPPGATDSSVNINFTNTNAQLIVQTNDGNCSDFRIDTINMTVDNIYTNINTIDSLLCVGDNTNLTAVTVNNQGAISGWVWTPAAPNAATINVAPGSTTTYSVTVTDGWGCTASDTMRVKVFTYPVVNIGPNDTVCNGGPVLLNATTAGATYIWNTAAVTPTLNAATSGTYWVDVTTNGCTKRDSIILGISTNPTVNITGDDSLCIGQSTTLTANPGGGAGGYTFLWAAGLGTANPITQSPVVPTTYTVTVTEAYGCTISGTKLVHVFPYPTVNLGPDTNICNGVVPFVTLDAQNSGAAYNWSTTANTQTINVNATGTYWVDVNTNGCVTRDSVQVNFSSNPTAGYTGITSICIGSSTELYGNGSGGTAPLTYTWSQGPTTADSISLAPLVTTPYSVITTDVAGCKDTAFFSITVNPYPVVNLGADTIGCIPAPITLFAPATTGTTLWSTGAATNSISVPTADTVWVDITENGCTTRDSVVVDYYPLPTVNLGPDTTICSIQNLLLDATNIYSTYVWSDASTTPTITVAQSNLYWVDVTSCGITVSDSIVVFMDTFSVYVVSLVPNDCGSSNGSLAVNSTSIYPTTYVWSGAGTGTNPALTNIADGNYIITATDSVGCIQTDTIPLVCNIPSVVITQLLTPNGDGKNDTWIIQGINNFPKAVVNVYNRWGNLVYNSVPYNNNWDGKSNSSLSLGTGYLPAGTYYYVVDVYGDGSDVKSGYLEFQP